jgi:hypothetical protein
MSFNHIIVPMHPILRIGNEALRKNVFSFKEFWLEKCVHNRLA